MELFDSFDRFRQTIRKDIQGKRPKIEAPLKSDSSTQKILLNHHQRSQTIIHDFKAQEGLKTNFIKAPVARIEGTLISDRFNAVKNPLQENLPILQIQKIQDLLVDTTETQFNQLKPEYVNELVKLSSVIMYKVKNSKFNT